MGIEKQKQELKSPEELAALQRAHEEKLEKEREKKEEEEAVRKAAEKKAGREHTRRKEAMTEYDTLREDVRKAETAGLKERIEKTEKLKESEQAKERELQETEAELNGVNEYISQLVSLIEGKGEGEIAPEVREAFNAAKAGQAEVGKTVKTVSGELKAIQAQTISPEELSRYQDAKAKMHELMEEIHRIDSNPFVRERFLKEAKGERDLRSGIIKEAKSLARIWENTPRSELVEKVCNSFLSEEFKSRGIDAMIDSEERLRTMKELTNNILVGMHGGVDEVNLERIRRVPDEKTRLNQYAGIVLKNFIGTHGTVDGTFGFMRLAEGGKPSVGLQKHLGTINVLRSYSFGIKDYDRKREVIPRFENWQGFDRELYNTDFIAEFDGPILPQKAEAGVKEIIAKEFDENREKAQKLEERLTHVEQEKLERDITELEAIIAKRSLVLEKVRIAEKIRDGEERGERSYGNKGLQHGIPRVQREIQDLTKSLQDQEAHFGGLRFYYNGPRNLDRYIRWKMVV